MSINNPAKHHIGQIACRMQDTEYKIQAAGYMHCYNTACQNTSYCMPLPAIGMNQKEEG